MHFQICEGCDFYLILRRNAFLPFRLKNNAKSYFAKKKILNVKNKNNHNVK